MVPSSCHPGMCRSSTGTEHNEHRDPDQEDGTTSQHARKRGPERQEALDARHAPCLSVLTASPLCQLLVPVRPEIIGKIMLLACRSNSFADPRPSSLPARPRATPWPKDRAWGPGPEQVLPRLHRCPRTFPNPGPHCYWRSDCRGFASTVGWCRADRASHAVADLDGDTVPDLVTAEIVGPKPWITRQRAPYLKRPSLSGDSGDRPHGHDRDHGGL